MIQPHRPRQTAVRQQEMREAANLLQATLLEGQFPDGQLYDDTPSRQVVVELLRQFRPTLLLAHAPEDYHPDHRAASQLAQAASWFSADSPPASSLSLVAVPLFAGSVALMSVSGVPSVGAADPPPSLEQPANVPATTPPNAAAVSRLKSRRLKSVFFISCPKLCELQRNGRGKL